ncbi:MAG TPA: DUF2752 domain-containing protein [Fimbriimonadaceae bacterium]|nr:DUF2752 domain-containing protein [Fimbriimonadaceae bacterium]
MPFLEPCDNKRVLSGQLIVTGIWATITIIGACLSPDPSGHGTHQQLGLPPCPSVLLFNRPCPGCGLTTSWTATIHGRFAEAFAAHPLGPILYGLLTLFAIINLAAFIKRQRVDTSGRKWMVGIVMGAVIFFGFGISRFVIDDHYRTTRELEAFIGRAASLQMSSTSR